MNNKEMAKTYADGFSGKYGNAETDGMVYKLFGHEIVKRDGDYYTFNWCGHHTQTTARHMNYILSALGSNKRVSYAQDRDSDINEFIYKASEWSGVYEQDEA
jgi:hypothetical protein